MAHVPSLTAVVTVMVLVSAFLPVPARGTSFHRTLIRENYGRLSFQKTLYYRDYRITVRLQIGDEMEVADVFLGFGYPTNNQKLHPGLSIFSNTSYIERIQRLVYTGNYSEWENNVEIITRGRSTIVHFDLVPSDNFASLPINSQSLITRRGFMTIDKSSSLWGMNAGYLISDRNFDIVRDQAYFSRLGRLADDGRTYIARCVRYGSFRTLESSACVVEADPTTGYAIVIDFESEFNYVPTALSVQDRQIEIPMSDGTSFTLLPSRVIPHIKNDISREIILGAPYLNHFDEIAMDFRTNTMYLRTDASFYNTPVATKIARLIIFSTLTYLLMIILSAVHYDFPAYVNHYLAKMIGFTVGFDVSRVYYELVGIAMAIGAGVVSAFSVPDGYMIAYALLLGSTVFHVICTVYILLVDRKITKNAFEQGKNTEGDEGGKLDFTTFESDIVADYVYPDVTNTNSIQRNIIRDIAHSNTVYLSMAMIFVQQSDVSPYLIPALVVSIIFIITNTLYVISLVAYVLRVEMIEFKKWPRFVIIGYVVVYGILTLLVGFIFVFWFMLPYFGELNNSVYPDSALPTMVLYGASLTVFLGAIRYFYNTYQSAKQALSIISESRAKKIKSD